MALVKHTLPSGVEIRVPEEVAARMGGEKPKKASAAKKPVKSEEAKAESLAPKTPAKKARPRRLPPRSRRSSMAVFISIDDLLPFAPELTEEKAEAMIADAMASAFVAAPCLAEEDLDETHAAAAKAVIRGAILRWNEAGSGGSSQLTALGFSQTIDTRQNRRSVFWPSEITALQEICQAASGDIPDGGWSYDMVGGPPIVHDEACSLVFGASYCSCGAELAQGYPLWGLYGSETA